MVAVATSHLPDEPLQQRLLLDALQDWLPKGHLAYFISDTIDSLDLSAFHTRYAKGGPRNQPIHPAMMVKVLIYAYATGTFSSRKLASLVKLGTVAVDGTKLKADASRHKATSHDCMLKAEQELKAQITGLLDRARAAYVWMWPDARSCNWPSVPGSPASKPSNVRAAFCAVRQALWAGPAGQTTAPGGQACERSSALCCARCSES